MDHQRFGDSSVSPPATGMAITSLVLGIVGLCLAPLGLVGLILGIIALSRSKSDPARYGGGGVAIAGICLGGASLVVGCLSVGVLLPALGAARQSARQLKSATQMRNVGQALILYAQANQDWYPEPGADWTARLLKDGSITADVLTAPEDPPGTMSYYYLPGYKAQFDSKRVILVERPGLRRNGGNVFFDDGHVDFLGAEDYQRLLDSLRTPDGKPFHPWRTGN
jgi:hypothetical protein